MTSTPVRDVKLLVNYVESKGEPANAGKTTDFGDIMNRITARAPQANTVRMSGAKDLSQNAGSPQRPLENKAETVITKTPDTTVTNTEAEQTTAIKAKEEPAVQEELAAKEGFSTEEAEALEPIREAVSEIVNTVAEALDITPEELLDVLSALGLTPESLLDPKVLSEVVTAVKGCDQLTLMTDETLSQNFLNLSDEVKTLTAALLNETGLTPEELKVITDKLKEMEASKEADVKIDDLTNPVNLTNEVANAELQAPQQQVTIVTENNGVITEITAKADDNGNIGATKNIATTTEPQITIEVKDENNSGSQSNHNQSGSQNFNGHEALLNGLLQNRLNNVEAKLEPVVPLNTPDTAQIMRQIMDFMKVSLSPKVDSLEMQLHPASLGTVGVKIVSTAGVITALFTAQNETVKATIEAQIVELKETMRAQGIKVENIEVNVKSQEFNSQLWQQGQDESSKQDQKGNRRRQLNLSGMDLEALTEELEGADKIAAEMMMANGQTVDFSA